jgi:hypothetical protein
VRHGHRAFDALARLRVPLIAALNGHTLGGGLELAATADFRITETHVKLGSPETGLGIIPGWSGTQRTVRRFGSQTVRRMALLGEIFVADEALKLGIVDRVVEKGESFNAAKEMASQLSLRGPLASSITKMLINAAEGEEVQRSPDRVVPVTHVELVERGGRRVGPVRALLTEGLERQGLHLVAVRVREIGGEDANRRLGAGRRRNGSEQGALPIAEALAC